MSGTSRPSSSMCAFHDVNELSSSDGSCPLLSSRTGLSDSGETRYRYQEISQATVITTSELTPDSTTTETCGDPSDLPIPPTVRRYCDELKRSAAPTIACSWSERRRRIGSATIVSSAVRGRVPRIVASHPPLRRLRSGGTVGVVGAPSRSQPCSTAASAHRGHTSTNPPPRAGEKRIAFSPIRSVRSQIAHERSTATRFTRVIAESVAAFYEPVIFFVTSDATSLIC